MKVYKLASSVEHLQEKNYQKRSLCKPLWTKQTNIVVCQGQSLIYKSISFIHIFKSIWIKSALFVVLRFYIISIHAWKTSPSATKQTIYVLQRRRSRIETTNICNSHTATTMKRLSTSRTVFKGQLVHAQNIDYGTMCLCVDCFIVCIQCKSFFKIGVCHTTDWQNKKCQAFKIRSCWRYSS